LLPARRYASVVFAVIACLKVCPFVTSRTFTETAKHWIAQTVLHNSPGTPVYDAKDIYELQWDQPQRGRQMPRQKLHFTTGREVFGTHAVMLKIFVYLP